MTGIVLQVFDNLIGNGLKFTEKGGRTTVGPTPSNSAVEFFVADTGSGIAADSLPHVLDRFWQAERTDRQGAPASNHVLLHDSMTPVQWNPSNGLKLLGPGRSRARREGFGSTSEN